MALLQKVEGEVTCHICLDTYEEPKLLPCFHIYCKKCLVRLPIRDTKGVLILTCPECRQVTPIPPGGVKDLKSAFYINRLLGIVQEEYKQEKLCCSEHADEELKLYCETCAKLICYECGIKGGKHHDHDYAPLDKAFQKYKEEISSSLEVVSKQMKSINQALDELNARRRQMLKIQATAEAEMRAQSQDARVTQLLCQLHEITRSKLTSLATQEGQQKITQARLKSCLDFMKTSMETDGHYDVLEMKSSVFTKIKELTVPIQPDILKSSTEEILYSGSAEALAVCQSTDILLFKG